MDKHYKIVLNQSLKFLKFIELSISSLKLQKIALDRSLTRTRLQNNTRGSNMKIVIS